MEKSKKYELFGQCLFKGTQWGCDGGGSETKGRNRNRALYIELLSDVTVKRYFAALLLCPFLHCNYYAIPNIDIQNVFIIHNALLIIVHGNGGAKCGRRGNVTYFGVFRKLGGACSVRKSTGIECREKC